MIAYLNYLFRNIQSRITGLEGDIEAVEEEELGFAMHMARQGAQISQERWAEIYEKLDKLKNERDLWQLVYDNLKKEHHTGNTDKPSSYYIDVVEHRIIPQLAAKELYEDCITLQKWIEALRNDLAHPKTEPLRPYVPERKWH